MVWLCECINVQARVCLQFLGGLLTWSVSHLFLSIPPLPPSCWAHAERTAVAILGHLLFGMLHLPARTASLSLLPSVCLSSLGSASCWLKLALRRQVCSTTLIPHYKKKKAQNAPPPLFLSLFPNHLSSGCPLTASCYSPKQRCL